MAGSSVSPSTPWFEESLPSLPSRPPSRLASLCLRSYAQIVEGEAVVGGDEVDAGVGAPAAVLVEIAGAGEAVAQLGGDALGAAPEAADGVAVAAVPLRPEDGEVAHLVAALAQVPRLGDEPDAGEDGILVDDVEERGELVDVVQLARERRGEIEAEAVDVHLDRPVAEAVHDELERLGVAHVQRVAAAGVVDVEARVARVEAVVAAVVDAAEAEGRALARALAGVVVDHVEDDLDAGAVERLDHLLELVHLLAEASAGGVAAGRREEAERGVAPVVLETAGDDLRLVGDLVDGEQLDGGDAELAQVADGGLGGEAGVGAAEGLGDVRVAGGEALDVHLVDHRVAPGAPLDAVVVPEEEVVEHDALGRARRVVARVDRALLAGAALHERPHGRAPVDLAGDGARVGVEDDLRRVEAVPLPRLVRPVDAVSVELPRRHPGHVPVEDVRAALGQRQRLALDRARGLVEEAEVDPRGVLGEEREVDAVPVVGGAEREGSSRPDARGHAGGSGIHRARPLRSGKKSARTLDGLRAG